jgi:hypothetical protein
MNIIKKWLMVPVISVSIVVSYNALYAGDNSSEKSGNKYIFSYDQEIPTLIRYGDKVSGVMSKTGYIGFILNDDGRSRSSIDFGYNLTYYDLQEPVSIGRAYALFGFGYIPILPELAFLIPGESREIVMLSPLIGYSYTYQLLNWMRFGFSVNTGPVYVKKITPFKDEYDFDGTPGMYLYNYDQWVTAYDAIGNISGKWGARINPKIKLYLLNFSDDTVHVGLGFGYVQYIFADNHFNSYDIGLDFTMAF